MFAKHCSNFACKTVLILCTLPSFLAAQSTITEIKEMREIVLAEIDPTNPDLKPVLIFDIDNTILMPKQMLASPQWFEAMVKFYLELGQTKPIAVRSSLARWIEAQKKTEMKLVEDYTADLIQDFREFVDVYALTARPVSLVETTLRQLKSAKIEQTSHFAGPLAKADIDLGADAKESAAFAGGVIFAGALNKKSLVFQRFFEQNKIPSPKYIMFVDDMLHNIEDMRAFADGLKIKFAGFRYGFADDYVKTLDLKITDVQESCMKNKSSILSDDEAREILAGRQTSC